MRKSVKKLIQLYLVKKSIMNTSMVRYLYCKSQTFTIILYTLLHQKKSIRYRNTHLHSNALSRLPVCSEQFNEQFNEPDAFDINQVYTVLYSTVTLKQLTL